jgi:Immunoglobulin I-set domain
VPLAYQWRREGTNISGATSAALSLINVRPADAGSYTVVITNVDGIITSAVAVITVQLAPLITTQPQSQSTPAGRTITFAVTADGSATLGYQWIRNGAAVAGNNLPTLTLTNASAADAGNYSVQVFNNFGVATSSTATLTVLQPPVIVLQPQSVSLNRLNPATTYGAQFSVVATDALGYAWFHQSGGSNVPLAGKAWVLNAHGTTLSIPDVRRTNAGGYFVVLTNQHGTTTSAVANLRVRVPASFNTNPGGLSLQPGGLLRMTFRDVDGGQPAPSDMANIGLEYTTQLNGTNTVWTPLPMVFNPTNGQWSAEDLAPHSMPRRYYRVVER